MPGVTITIAIQDMAAETITVEAASDEQRKTCATPSIASLPTANLNADDEVYAAAWAAVGQQIKERIAQKR